MALAVLAPLGTAEPDPGPDEYQCVGPNHPSLALVYETECGLGRQAWQYVWHYPPGAYQAWCIVTHDCPCPHCPPAAEMARTW